MAGNGRRHGRRRDGRRRLRLDRKRERRRIRECRPVGPFGIPALGRSCRPPSRISTVPPPLGAGNRPHPGRIGDPASDPPGGPRGLVGSCGVMVPGKRRSPGPPEGSFLPTRRSQKPKPVEPPTIHEVVVNVGRGGGDVPPGEITLPPAVVAHVRRAPLPRRDSSSLSPPLIYGSVYSSHISDHAPVSHEERFGMWTRLDPG